MELWGSSYLLHDVTPVRLVATVGSSTPSEGTGSVMLSFTQEPGVFTTVRDSSKCKIDMKWDVALRLLSLLHVLVLQNTLLRGEPPEIRVSTGTLGVFTVAGGLRSGPIECSWDAGAVGIKCGRVVGGGADDFELVLAEDAAAELVVTLAKVIASNGIRNARKGAGAT